MRPMMNKALTLLICNLSVLPALAEQCLPCPQPVCMEALEIPIDLGYCAPNWVLVKNPHAPECKDFAKNFADLCPQCPHNIRPPGVIDHTPEATQNNLLSLVRKYRQFVLNAQRSSP